MRTCSWASSASRVMLRSRSTPCRAPLFARHLAIEAKYGHVVTNSNSCMKPPYAPLVRPHVGKFVGVHMSYVRYPRAAVAVATSTSDQRNRNPLPRTSPPTSAAPVVLWASHALPVPGGGRLVGVRRISSTEVEVGRLAPGDARVEWVAAELLLTEHAARRWLARARFSRQ